MQSVVVFSRLNTVILVAPLVALGCLAPGELTAAKARLLKRSVGKCMEKGHRANETDLSPLVRRVFYDLEGGVVSQRSTAIKALSGWLMTLPSGREVHRSVLQDQATKLIVLGPEAVPLLFEWVMHENLAIRYVAVYSLQKITGISGSIGYFDTQDKGASREKAIRLWRKWWEKHHEEGNDKGTS